MDEGPGGAGPAGVDGPFSGTPADHGRAPEVDDTDRGEDAGGVGGDRGEDVGDLGDVDDSDEDAPPADIAQSALADARSMVGGGGPGGPGGLGRRHRRGDRDAARRTRRENLAGRNRGGYSGPGPDPRRDPQRVGSMLADYVTDRGWDKPLAQARVFAEWSVLVGVDVAAHCRPQALHEGELRVSAESTAWATQLRLLSGTLLARLVAELGDGVVTKLHISGPTGPSWKHGGWSVRGARGPRDTYG